MSKDANYFDFVENIEWEVLTPTGFQDFKGIASSKNENLIKINFDDGSDIIVTSGHEFITNTGPAVANTLVAGDEIFSESGKSKIVEILSFNETRTMFDLVEVSNGNVYYTGQKLSKNCLMIDEAAFIQEHIWEDFYNSVYPTISSGKTSKIIMVSTPKGMNHFFNIYNDAARNKSSFYAVKIPWWERPDRDETWKDDQLKNMSQIQFNQEFGCFRNTTKLDINGRIVSIGDLFDEM